MSRYSDFGAESVDDLTAELFVETLRDELELLCFDATGSDEVDVRGTLWGGNLAMICSLIETCIYTRKLTMAFYLLRMSLSTHIVLNGCCGSCGKRVF